MVTTECPGRPQGRTGPGRPSSYNDVIADAICSRIAHGESLRAICDDPEMPHRSTVIRWLARDDGFLQQYETARRIQADVWRDEIYDLAKAPPPRNAQGQIDTAALMHRRNQIGTLRWLSEKLTRRN